MDGGSACDCSGDDLLELLKECDEPIFEKLFLAVSGVSVML